MPSAGRASRTPGKSDSWARRVHRYSLEYFTVAWSVFACITRISDKNACCRATHVERCARPSLFRASAAGQERVGVPIAARRHHRRGAHRPSIANARAARTDLHRSLHERGDLLLRRRAADVVARRTLASLVEEEDAVKIPLDVTCRIRDANADHSAMARASDLRVGASAAVPGKAALANVQIGLAAGPLTFVLAMRWQPGLLVGTPLLSQKSGTCPSGSSCPPNSSEGKMRISSFGPKLR